ncbi:MAG TPA: cytochrome P450 [Myxococcota bacterium]|jgi:cytochrome P450|nr:cytochrome P450 [Myxococcota bacterium]
MAEPAYDPFEEFNRSQGQGRIRDPYPYFAQLRRQAPAHKIPATKLLGDHPRPPGMPDHIYVVVSHEAVCHVLLDGETFSSQGYGKTMGLVMGRTILEMDEPEHARYRGLLQKAFTKRALDRWERELVRPVVNGLIDRFAGRGRADLVRELTFPFPVTVIAGMIGLDESDHDLFHRLAIELISITIDPLRGMRASQSLRELFARVLADRRREPRDDLMTVLAQAELEGTRLEDEAIYAFLRLLAPAGAETTYRSSSNLLFGLLSNPAQLSALRADRALMLQAIEEGLRWETPLTSIMRTTTRDVRIGDLEIPKDSLVSVNLGAANRDETRYERAEEFDIQRPQKTHMAFAFGAHRCLGMHLARMETSVALNALLDRLPNLRLDPAAEDVHVTGLTFRSPVALPVVFDAA